MTDASEGIDLGELRRLAEAATPGPWSWHSRQTADCDSWAVFDSNDSALAVNHDGWAPDAEFIAATDPQTVLALIERVRNDETPVSRWESRAKRVLKQRDGWRKRAESAERRIEKVERLRDLMERDRDELDESVRLSTILVDLNAALTEGDEQ